MSDELESDRHHRVATTTYAIAIVGAGMAVALLIFSIFIKREHGAWTNILLNHFPATVGLLGAAFAAFVVVAVFRTSEGKIRFSLLGLKFEGASGPIVMWVLCFMAVVLGINMLWPLH